jgi:hypothetical protein
MNIEFTDRGQVFALAPIPPRLRTNSPPSLRRVPCTSLSDRSDHLPKRHAKSVPKPAKPTKSSALHFRNTSLEIEKSTFSPLLVQAEPRKVAVPDV